MNGNKVAFVSTVVLVLLIMPNVGAVYCRDEEMNNDHCNTVLAVLHRTENDTCDAPAIDPVRSERPRPTLFTVVAQFGIVVSPDGHHHHAPLFFRNSWRGDSCGDSDYQFLNADYAGPNDWGKIVDLSYETPTLATYKVEAGSIMPDIGSLPGCWHIGNVRMAPHGAEFGWSYKSNWGGTNPRPVLDCMPVPRKSP